MYYALVTLLSLVMATAVGFFHPDRHGKVITGGIAGFIIGLVLIVYGRFYYESTLNPFPVTANDIMFAGLTLGVIGFITAFGLSLFVPPMPKEIEQPHVRREDVGYWRR
ncbi:MAG: hypothetical protein JWN75_658 [Candidatus Saccharibacteria bacterium]|nr:hypothetical protein [Candidatus Saccharibacteria bacterium]